MSICHACSEERGCHVMMWNLDRKRRGGSGGTCQEIKMETQRVEQNGEGKERIF